MYKGIRAQRSGQSFTDTGAGKKTKSLSLKLEDNAHTRNLAYGGTKIPDPQGPKKQNTLGRAIAQQEEAARRSALESEKMKPRTSERGAANETRQRMATRSGTTAGGQERSVSRSGTVARTEESSPPDRRSSSMGRQATTTQQRNTLLHESDENKGQTPERQETLKSKPTSPGLVEPEQRPVLKSKSTRFAAEDANAFYDEGSGRARPITNANTVLYGSGTSTSLGPAEGLDQSRVQRLITRGPTLFHDSHRAKTQELDQQRTKTQALEPQRTKTQAFDEPQRTRTLALDDQNDVSGSKPVTRGKTLFEDSYNDDPRRRSDPEHRSRTTDLRSRTTDLRSPTTDLRSRTTDLAGQRMSSPDLSGASARTQSPMVRGAKTEMLGPRSPSEEPKPAQKSKTVGALGDGDFDSSRTSFLQRQGQGPAAPPPESPDRYSRHTLTQWEHPEEYDRELTRELSQERGGSVMARASIVSAVSPMARGGDRPSPKKWSSPMEKLHGGHYENIVGLRERTAEDAAKRELDQDLLAMLAPDIDATRSPQWHSKSPGTSPAPNMRTAFTDRTLRLRDDMGKSVLTGTERLQAEDGAHQDCNCASCQPYNRQAAGLPSTLLPANKGTNPKGGEHGKRSNSNLVGTAIHKMFADNPEGRQEAFSEELLLKKQFGMRSRARSADPMAAGNFNGDIGRNLPSRLGHRPSRGSQPQIADPRARSDIAMVMNPSKDDAPPPSQITRFVKGTGECRMPSAEAETLSVRWNQPLYRFEICAGEEYKHPRAVSLPPPRRNVISNEGVDVRDCSLGNPARGDAKLRHPGQNDSTNMTIVTNNHIANQYADTERAMRFEKDKKFADLCATTTEARQKQCQMHSDIVSRNHHSWSNNMAETLKWGGD